MVETNASTLVLLLGDAEAGAGEDAVDVHTVNTDVGVVLKVEIDVLINTETKVAGVREVLGLELVVLDSKSLKNG